MFRKGLSVLLSVVMTVCLTGISVSARAPEPAPVFYCHGDITLRPDKLTTSRNVIIRSEKYTDYCLGVEDGLSRDNTDINLEKIDLYSVSQHFKLIPVGNGYYVIELSYCKGKNLDIYRNSEVPRDGKLQVYKYTGSKNQIFKLKKSKNYGSYYIMSENGAYLTCDPYGEVFGMGYTGKSNQRFYIYNTYDDYSTARYGENFISENRYGDIVINCICNRDSHNYYPYYHKPDCYYYGRYNGYYGSYSPYYSQNNYGLNYNSSVNNTINSSISNSISSSNSLNSSTSNSNAATYNYYTTNNYYYTTDKNTPSKQNSGTSTFDVIYISPGDNNSNNSSNNTNSNNNSSDNSASGNKTPVIRPDGSKDYIINYGKDKTTAVDLHNLLT